MKIPVLCDILEGDILNDPSISFITQIHTNILKIKEGDAYFARSIKNLKKALDQGAFAIILTQSLYNKLDPTDFDHEIAWIQVDDLNKSVWKYLRYFLSDKDVEIYHIDIIMSNLIQCFKNSTMEDILLLSNDWYNDFEHLYSIENKKFIYGTNLDFLQYIYPNTSTFKKRKFTINNLTMHSLFETSFSNKSQYFEKLKLPYLYINHLLQLKENFIYELDLKRLGSLNLFKPIFINKSCDIVNNGTSNRFILCSDEKAISTLEINYLKKYYKYGKLKILDFTSLSKVELLKIITDEDYNALYIKNIDKESLYLILMHEKSDQTLF
jgi:hypothetical protein